MYGLVPEKTLRLVYEPLYLAIYNRIRDFLRDHQMCLWKQIVINLAKSRFVVNPNADLPKYS